MSRFLMRVLAFLNLLSIALAALLILYLFHKFFRQRRRETAREKYLRDLQETWRAFFFGPDDVPRELVPRNAGEIAGAEDFLLSYQRNVQSPGVEDKIRRFAALHLQEHYRRLLKTGKWSVRMNTLHRVADFKMDGLLDVCRGMLDGKTTGEERFVLAHIFSMLDERAFLARFGDLSRTFTEFEYKKILLGLRPALFEEMVRRWDGLSTAARLSIIDVAGTQGELRYLPMLEGNLDSPDREIRIRSLKAIGKIGAAEDIGRYLHLTESESWEERLMAARLMGSLPLAQTRQYLETLSGDGNWWVRTEALRHLKAGRPGAPGEAPAAAPRPGR